MKKKTIAVSEEVHKKLLQLGLRLTWEKGRYVSMDEVIRYLLRKRK